MYEVFKHTVCVPASFLIEEQLITKYMYDNYIRRQKIQRVRRASYNSCALVSVRSLPEDIRVAVEEKLGVFDNKANNILRKHCRPNEEAETFFATFKLPDGRYLPYDKQVEYSNNAMLLEACRSTYNLFVSTRKKCGGSTAPAWQQVLDCLAKIDDIKHSLGSSKRLRDKLRGYEKEGFACLVPGYWRNNNSAKVKTNEQEALMRQLLRKHNNFDNMQIAHLYNMVAEKMSWDTVVAQTVANYREKWNMTISSFNTGAKEFRNTKAMIVKRKVPSMPLYYWTVDGWDVELLYQVSKTDKKGKRITSYTERPNIVVVLDPCINYPIGYAIGTHETPALIREALRNAVVHTSELFGDMHRVHQIQTDNYGKKTMKPFYESVSALHTPAAVGNAKSKRIEPWFKYLNKNYCQYQHNWSGFGVTSSKKKQPNAEYLDKIKRHFPTYDELTPVIAGFIEKEREALKEKYIEAYKELPANDKMLLSYEDYLFTLGESTGWTNRLANDGLHITIGREKKVFDSFDARFRNFSERDWVVKFDPKDTEQILATTDDGSLRFLLESKHEIAMAVKDRGDDDVENLKAIRQFNDNLEDAAIEEMGKDHQLVDTMFAERPELKDTLSKMVLTDSLGRHKNLFTRQKTLLKGVEKTTKKQDLKDKKKAFKNQQEYYANKVNLENYTD